MDQPPGGTGDDRPSRHNGSVAVMSRAELAHCRHWRNAFAEGRKDHRFYELVEDTIRQGFDYRYFAIKDRDGDVQAVQPFFILDQDLLAGVDSAMRGIVRSVRRAWPRFLRLRTMMVGCAVGEACLDGPECSHASNALLLASDDRGACTRSEGAAGRPQGVSGEVSGTAELLSCTMGSVECPAFR